MEEGKKRESGGYTNVDPLLSRQSPPSNQKLSMTRDNSYQVGDVVAEQEEGSTLDTHEPTAMSLLAAACKPAASSYLCKGRGHCMWPNHRIGLLQMSSMCSYRDPKGNVKADSPVNESRMPSIAGNDMLLRP